MNTGNKTKIEIHFCIPDDEKQFLPMRRRTPTLLPPNAPLPRQGEVLYLSKESAWCVELVIHEWSAPTMLRVEVWLQHLSLRRARPTGFMLTQ